MATERYSPSSSSGSLFEHVQVQFILSRAQSACNDFVIDEKKGGEGTEEESGMKRRLGPRMARACEMYDS